MDAIYPFFDKLLPNNELMDIQAQEISFANMEMNLMKVC